MTEQLPARSPDIERTHRGAETSAFLRAEAERMAQLCIGCGNCLRACPMLAFAPAAQQAGSDEVMQGVRSVLRGEAANAASLAWISVCSRSALCRGVCPVAGLDPAFMMRVAKMRAMGALGDAAQIAVHEDTQFAPRVKAFARLTFSETEQEAWL